MNEIPSMWRVELLHPMLIHLPLVLLPLAAILRLVHELLPTRMRSQFLLPASRLLLALGVVFVWPAIYTGELADSAVVRSLCDPTVVEEHENLSYITAYIFSAAALVEVGLAWKNWRTGLLRRLANWLVILSMLGGSGVLLYVGHLGASLVYQQAAGVYQPTEGCKEFE